MGEGCPLVGVEWLCVRGGGEVAAGSLLEAVGVGEQLVDGGPHGLFEPVGGQVAGVVGAAVLRGDGCRASGALVEAGLAFDSVDAGDGAAAGAAQEASEGVEMAGALLGSGGGADGGL